MLLLLFVSFFSLSAQHIFLSKRSAEEDEILRYGDEPFTPEPLKQPYRDEQEVFGKKLDQLVPNGKMQDLKPSGYRVKREQNAYGDEMVTPGTSYGNPPGTYEQASKNPEEVEENPVDNGYETEAPEVFPSGYRK